MKEEDKHLKDSEIIDLDMMYHIISLYHIGEKLFSIEILAVCAKLALTVS